MDLAPTHFTDAQPLFDNGYEAASSRVTVIVSISEPFRVNGQNSRAFIAGPQTEPLHIAYPLSANCLEWSFPIFDVWGVFGLHPKDVCNRIVDLTDIGSSENAKRALDGLSIRLDSYETTQGAVLRFVWNAMKNGSDATLTALSDQARLGLRRIEQLFQNELGLAPKQIHSLLRYERTCEFLSVGEADLAEVALLAGYSDQSHMTRDFKRFAGSTPAKFRSALKRLQ